jgi:hypothetical protein
MEGLMPDDKRKAMADRTDEEFGNSNFHMTFNLYEPLHSIDV